MTTRVLTTEQSDEWSRLLASMPMKDTYFTPEYASVYEKTYAPEIDAAFGGPAFLFSYEDENGRVLYPFIRRTIDFSGMTRRSAPVYDIISHYGYGGPLMHAAPEREHALAHAFATAFTAYCLEEHIVSEFVRFHPLFQTEKPFEGLLPLMRRNSLVWLDLTKGGEVLFAEMDRKTRNLIKKAQKSGVTVRKDNSAVAAFTELYLQTMERNGTHARYFFPVSFYENTLNALGENASLFVAEYEGKIIAASLFMHEYGSMHYHFSGSDRAYAPLAASQLIIWTAAQWGAATGYKRLHLGGGNGKADSLFHFKAGFSSDRAQFCTASIIHDRALYDALCAEHEAHAARHGRTLVADYFPGYRKPEVSVKTQTTASSTPQIPHEA